MFWEEKIDLIAKKHGPDGFKNPFTAWPEILKNIEDKFIIRTYDSNWEDNVKQKEELAIIEIKELNTLLSSLPDKNYWLVMMMGDYPTAKRLIYDCNIAALKDLISLSKYDFYIVDKKYNWLTYFKCGTEKITLYKSGITNSPFDIRASG
ncbi:DUF6756 family protein [Chitinophaga niabensis]|uniref:Uncharacterized protein n=1 Tax=Chitinophaga niabensis TaxID=536979 RepID=A0A1N6JER2_9BACT|nr:DUF6756 family protein [Chitinophaga niabensis]SIO42693.1 hypothetical protein SAMN04488055_3927 [Chitinophaga niabensis]